MLFAYFAKHSVAGWICVSSKCAAFDTHLFDQVFTAANGYIRTKIVELD